MKLDPKLRYFGRSLDASEDLNGDSLPDVSVGSYGNVLQLWWDSLEWEMFPLMHWCSVFCEEEVRSCESMWLITISLEA